MAFGGFGFGGGNRVHVDIVGDASHLKRETKEARADIDKFGRGSSRSLGKSATLIRTGFAAVAGSAILGVVQQMDEMNLKAEATERLFAQVFGEMEQDARDWASEQKEAFGVSQTGMENLLASTSDLLVPMGFARDEAFELSKEMLILANATSEASGGAITAEDAVSRIGKAATGERENLKQLGIVIKDADIKARLAAKGLDDLTGEARKQAEAVALVELAYEQSADKLDLYNDRAGTAIALNKELRSETRDTAESFSRALEPAIEGSKEAALPLIEALGFLGEKFQQFQRDSDELAEAGNPFEQFIGRARDLLTSGAIPGIINLVKDLTSETDELTDEQKEAADSASQLTDAELRARAAHDQAGEAADRHAKDLERLKRAEELQADATRDAVKAIGEKQEALRNVHNPLFRLVSLNEDLAEAEEAVEEAQEEGVGSEEYRDAVINRAQVIADLQDTLLDLKDRGIDPTGEAARNMLMGLGVPPEVITEIFATFDLLQQNLGERDWDINVGVNFTAGRTPPAIRNVVGGRNVSEAVESGFIGHTGGRVNAPRGQEVRATLLGGETVVPLNGNGNGGGTTYNVFVLSSEDFRDAMRDQGIEVDRLGLNLV